MVLSKDEVRKYLQGMKLTDDEIEAISESIYQIAEMVIEIHQKVRSE